MRLAHSEALIRQRARGWVYPAWRPPCRSRARPSTNSYGEPSDPNEWLVEREPFAVPPRLLARPSTAREEILTAAPGLVDEQGEFRVTELLCSLNAGGDRRRYLALRQALRFMIEGGRGRGPEFERVRHGVYR